MDNDVLKSAWQNEAIEAKTANEIKLMMQRGAHPVLKGIRKQLIIESIAFAVFLLVYYDFFDGHLKPLYANIVLVASMAFVIIHNIIGYLLTKSRTQGDNIKNSLEDRLSKMKVYAASSILSRSLATGCMLLFFMSAVLTKAFSNWTIFAIILIFVIQMASLSVIWMKRIQQLKNAIQTFDS